MGIPTVTAPTRARSGVTGPVAPRRARGAAMTETIVLMFVMLPLMFAIPMIGKLVDLRQTAVQAARYAAWESTVHEDLDAPAQLSERFFGDGSAPITTAPGGGGTSTLWGDAGPPDGSPDGLPARTAVRVRDGHVTTLTYDEATHQARLARGLGGAIGAVGGALGQLGDGEWDIGETSIEGAGVRVGVERGGWLADVLGEGTSEFEERAVILSDNWAAADERAEQRVKALVPATVLEPIGDLLAHAGKVPFLKELEGLDGAFGHVDMDQLPDEAFRKREFYGIGDFEER